MFAAGDAEGLSAIFRQIDAMQKTRMIKVSAETMDHFKPFAEAALYCMAAVLLAALDCVTSHGSPLCAILVLVLMWVAETLHQRRVTSLASLAFGGRQTTFLRRVLPWLKAPAACHLGAPRAGNHASERVHPPEKASEGEIKHVMMILDVSPSMQLIDTGKEGMISRRKQCATLVQSFSGG